MTLVERGKSGRVARQTCHGTTASRTFLVEVSEPAGTCAADGRQPLMRVVRGQAGCAWRRIRRRQAPSAAVNGQSPDPPVP